MKITRRTLLEKINDFFDTTTPCYGEEIDIILSDPEMKKMLLDIISEERRRKVNGESTDDLGLERL